MKVRDELIEIFSDCLKINKDKVSDDTSPDNAPGWDSLAMVTIITAVEKKFNVVFNYDELQRFNSFGGLCSILEEKRRGR